MVKYVKEFEFPSSAGFTESVQYYKEGGSVKKMGKMKTSKMDSMDRSTTPGTKVAPSNQLDAEHGGTKDLYPGFKKGGKAKKGKKKEWIKDSIKKPGALRKALDVKEGEDIPKEKLEKAAKKPGKMGKRARLAETLGSFDKKAKGGFCRTPRHGKNK